MNLFNLSNFHSKKNSGFTLIELIVVIFIIGILSGLIMFNYKNFRTDVSVENLSQDIALAVRRAQVYSTSTKGTDASFPSYGIYFNLPSGSGANTIFGTDKAFVFFADVPVSSTTPIVPGNGTYDQSTSNCGSPTATDECLEIMSITSSDKIVELCDDQNNCYDSSSNPNVSIVFTRPNPEARICFSTGGTCTTISNVTIKIESLNKKTRSINIWNTGLIDTK